jgi:outer membrane biosynthesis protein TonB
MSIRRTISDASTSRRWTFGVSIAVHVVALVWGALTFAAKPLTSVAEPMPVDIVSISEFTQLTSGSRTAEAATPIVDKLGERNPANDPAAKVAKTEVHAATDATAPEPKPPTPEKPEKKRSEPQDDAIAEAIKKDLAKSEPKKAEQRRVEPKPEKKVEAKSEPKTPPKKDQPKFDPRKVEALLDKRTPQRVAATGDVVNSAVGLGAPEGTANQLSQSEIGAFLRHLKNCWSPPPGAISKRFLVPVTIRLKMDRTLAAPPEVEMKAADPYSRAVIESTVRALIQCQPYTMFSLPRYELWKELPLNFDPFDMLGG